MDIETHQRAPQAHCHSPPPAGGRAEAPPASSPSLPWHCAPPRSNIRPQTDWPGSRPSRGTPPAVERTIKAL